MPRGTLGPASDMVTNEVALKDAGTPKTRFNAKSGRACESFTVAPTWTCHDGDLPLSKGARYARELGFREAR